MAVNSIQFPVDFVKNNNSNSLGYGKYYGRAHNAETLSNEGRVFNSNTPVREDRGIFYVTAPSDRSRCVS